MQAPPVKWLVALGAGAFVILSGSMILLGAPVWTAALTTLLIFGLMGIGVTMGIGLGVIRSRDFLARGIDFALQSDFSRARRWVLAAVRVDRSLLRIHEVHRLYDFIVAGDSSSEARDEIRRMKAKMSSWPKSKSSAIFLSPGFRVILIIFAVVYFLGRLFSHE
jgi:hypothetical protein